MLILSRVLEIDNAKDNARTAKSGVIVSQSISHVIPRVVTCDSGDIGGWVSALIRPGGPTSRSRHQVIKR